MRFASLFSLLAFVIGVLAEQYIVELKPGTNMAAFKEMVTRNGGKVVREFGTKEIFYGVVVETKSDNIDTMSAWDGVKHVYLDQVYSIPDCGKGPC
ncbi:hypothetical protein GQ53DRAFT_755267 [Thozetella sp. PMI_491]|nr:hypothetical protein GQ53DRAFT_755267 [Thozetella sp. PMI_491]